MTGGRIFLIDDEPDLRASTAQALDLAGFTVQEFAGGDRVGDLVSFGFPGIVLTDIRMPGIDGLTLMNLVHAIDPDIPVILMTGHGDVQLAVRAMREGAHDFVEKPFSAPQLVEIATRALQYRRLVLENRVLRAARGQVDDLEQRLLGRSNVMIDLRRRIRTLGPAEADVLIVGETGAGKEVAARALHDLSDRASRPFVAIDCASLPAALIESELFGHEAGAFPGAMRPRYGKFEHARGGTILLDDIGSMPIEVQGKLLRVIQERAITRLGS
ncbi:MAG: sigma-54 dependent transcriptional regulator, partial [Paracoccaceae bacterium]|nr:sigma-54 dependent transcriptional regulator [Paracoccaceae bacterium]